MGREPKTQTGFKTKKMYSYVVVADDYDDDDDVFICRNHLVIISIFIYAKEAHVLFFVGLLFISKEQINVGL